VLGEIMSYRLHDRKQFVRERPVELSSARSGASGMSRASGRAGAAAVWTIEQERGCEMGWGNMEARAHVQYRRATYVHARDPISQAGVVAQLRMRLRFGWSTRRLRLR
jgi:hypothetical protein